MVFAGCSAVAGGQVKPAELKPDIPFVFNLTKDSSREFQLDLKKGDYAEFEWKNQLDGFWIETAMISPNGKEILYGDGLIIPATGVYKYRVSLKGDAEAASDKIQKLTLTYKNVLKIPADTVVGETRKINGYDVKIIVPKNKDEGGESFVLIERAGKPEAMLKGDAFGISGFNFANSSVEGGDESNSLFAKTTDITGEGTPDIGIEYFSGGAHCCFDFYVFELGKEVKQIPPVSGRDNPISAGGVNPKGGLFLETGDSTFAYWNVPFAGSPLLAVTLEFRGDSFHASPARMKKPAPAMAELQKQAAEAKSKLNNVAYKGDSFAGITEDDGYVFEDAFWGTMLDLIYTGNNELAWKYFDMVWPATKPGKEIFKKDFRTRLENSPYWEDIKPANW